MTSLWRHCCDKNPMVYSFQTSTKFKQNINTCYDLVGIHAKI